MRENRADFHTMAYLKKRRKNIPITLLPQLSFFFLFLFKYHNSQPPGVLQELQGETRVAQARAVQLNYQDLKETRVLRQYL